MNTLYVVATPIGNLEDITIRAIKILLSTRIIACEDTRRTGQLIKILENRYSSWLLAGQVIGHEWLSVRDWNEAQMVPRILAKLAESDVVLVSDAGTPLISDPGFKIVRATREAGFKVVPIPGPSAVTAALSAAGLPTDKFFFMGFWRKQQLPKGVTTVVYESPRRVNRTVAEIKDLYPKSRVVLAREMTKIYEYIGEDDGVTSRGEVVILVSIADETENEIAAVHG